MHIRARSNASLLYNHVLNAPHSVSGRQPERPEMHSACLAWLGLAWLGLAWLGTKVQTTLHTNRGEMLPELRQRDDNPCGNLDRGLEKKHLGLFVRFAPCAQKCL
jgi:hypothetical protein